MRAISLGDRTIHLTEEQYETLLHRFDVQEADRRYWRSCICPRTEKGYADCPACPLYVFGSAGCFGLLTCLDLNSDSLWLYTRWICAAGAPGLAGAKRIHDFLLSLPRVPDAE